MAIATEIQDAAAVDVLVGRSRRALRREGALEAARNAGLYKPLKYGVVTHHHSDHVPGSAVYAAADLITYPSLYEGFGNALIEAFYFRDPDGNTVELGIRIVPGFYIYKDKLTLSRVIEDAQATEIGLRTLDWLSQLQRAPRGHFRPIGSNGFYRRGEQRADFDQQPIEALAMVSACAEAYRTTEDPRWLNEARLAFEWFLGRNDLGLELYDPSTGGCYDGLHEDRINENQGAESTLAFLLSLAELNLVESSLAAFRRAAEMADSGRG